MTDLTFEQLTKLIETAKAAGVKEIHAGGVYVKFKQAPLIELKPKPDHAVSINAVENKGYPLITDLVGEISSSFVPKDVPETKAEELIKPMSVLDELSAEEVLYYATPHYDQIQADKEAHKKKLAGDPQ